MPLLREINDEFCNLLKGWHELEKTLPDGDTIVDFDLPAWPSKTIFQSRKEVLRALEDILANESTRTDRMFHHRVYGLHAYLLDVLNQKTTPIDEYLPATMGFKLSYIPDAELALMKQRAIESLGKIGVDFRVALKGLEVLSAKVPVDEIPAWFKRQFEQASKQALKLFPYAPELPEPGVSIFDDASMTRARISGTGKQFHVEFNKRVVKEENEENLQNTLRHEILGHGLQASLWADKILEDTWPSYRGMTSMQSVEVFQMEALAEYAPAYYGDISDLRSALADINMLSRQVTNNVNYMILKKLESPDAAEKYFLSYLTYRDENFAAARVRHVESTALTRCYSPVYGPAHRLTRHIMESLPISARDDFMRKMYEDYMDPTDIQDLGISMGAQPMKYFEPCRPPGI